MRCRESLLPASSADGDAITLHTGLAQVTVGLPRIRYRLAENKHAYVRRAQVDRTAARQPENHGCD